MSSYSYFSGSYPFVETFLDRSSNLYFEKRKQEENITLKIRSAVNYCKSLNSIYSNDISKLTSHDKINIEKCLNDNYLSKDSNYFGKREAIFIDLY